MPDETIPVRQDETFDEAKLADYLRDKLDGTNQPLTVTQFPGGAANLTYLLHYGESHQYVLRRPPLGPVAPKSHDMAREYSVLSVLYQEFAPSPRAYHFCDDVDIIGAPFLIMERREGVVVRREMPKAFKGIENAAEQLSQALVDTLVDFHAVDTSEIGLDELGKPEGFLERQVEGWWGRWQKAKVDENPVFDDLYAWLKENLPAPQTPTLLHNDYKLDNTMFAPHDPSKLVAVFDWDMCTRGDPLVDLGTLLAYWSEKNDPPFYKGLLGMPVDDFLSREALVERYAEKSRRDVSQIRWYHVLALYRVVVIIAQIYVRYHRGQTRDERFAAFKDLIPIISQNAYDLATAD